MAVLWPRLEGRMRPLGARPRRDAANWAMRLDLLPQPFAGPAAFRNGLQSLPDNRLKVAWVEERLRSAK